MPEPVDKRRQSAVALAYGGSNGDGAPKVVAKGSGMVAEQIMQRARDAGVFVHESKELVQLLMGVDLDREIPPALYRAIAELLAWLYHIESARKNGTPLPAAPDPTPHLPPERALDDAPGATVPAAATTEEEQ
jgi:flagellar biosynthesis protein